MSSGCGLSGRSGSAEDLLCARLGLQTVPLALLSDSMQQRLVSNAPSSESSNSRNQLDQLGDRLSQNNMNHRNQRTTKNGRSEYGADDERSTTGTGLDLIVPAMFPSEALGKHDGAAPPPAADIKIPDDSKLLANPKGIIMSFLPTASATDPEKFENYRRLCLTHVAEYFNRRKGGVAGGGGGAVCLVCNASCRHWHALQRHLQTHLDFRPFACDLCSRTFYSQSKLKRHRAIHSDVKPYQCPFCDRRLGRTEHLKRHLLVHTDRKPYGCSACAHTTKRLDGIRRHIKRKHGGDAAADIVSLLSPSEAEEAMARRLANAEPAKPKSKKKKKKKKTKKEVAAAAAAAAAENSGCDLVDRRDVFPGNILDVAASFGVQDLKMHGLLDGSGGKQQRPEDCRSGGRDAAQHRQQQHQGGGNDSRSGGCGSGSGAEDLKSVWDSNQMLLSSQQQMQQLLYQSLVRFDRPPAGGDVPSRNAATPTMPGGPSGAPRAHPSFPLKHGVALSHQNDAFAANVSGVPTRYSASGSASDAGGPSSSRNAVLLSPPGGGGARANVAAACYGQMDPGTEMMISQYFQSHQRFAPPVWGFANPNYHGYQS